MKQLTQYIQEKLKINSKSKINVYNPDFLNNIEEVIYDDEGDEHELDSKWNYCESELKRINKNYSGFIVAKWDPLSELEDFDNNISLSSDLEDIKDDIISGKDLGYEVRLSHGHLEIDCINSGSRATYYVYALKDTAYADVELYFDGEGEDENGDPIDIKKILFTKGNILIITI